VDMNMDMDVIFHIHGNPGYRRNRLTHTSEYAANTYESTKLFEYIRIEMNIQHCSAGPAL